MLDLTYTAPKPKVIAGAKQDWELVIGMEIHAQVASNAKLFSGASTQVGAEPNSNVAFVDAAMPGMLPVINEYCVEQAVRSGLGLKAAINLRSAFDRKNYFYPDLPQGYQISQLYHPIVGEGEVLVELSPGVARLVRIERIHLEQDAGKSIHDMDPTMSFVDFNRTGVALMEIVSRPDIRGPEEAAAYVAKLRQILRYLGTCDGNMQNGNLRADVNVSICAPGQYEKYQATQDFSHLGTRCEIKNMNSLRFIRPRLITRPAARSPSSKMAARSCRKPGFMIRTRTKPGRCAPRKKRMITAISRAPISCRWRLNRLGSMTLPPVCRNCPMPRKPGSWGISV
jgi:aspartyl-tRNA(Asn)/glutamyl-tRNA(Gln) amidotransferase subunit B